ncbi:MAG: hypothetical protein GVY08_00780 [Bacteroidetes bacterium]|jgi:hypothetical protein|nr:hypothetical protein [Bacteroidota bacterium]
MITDAGASLTIQPNRINNPESHRMRLQFIIALMIHSSSLHKSSSDNDFETSIYVLSPYGIALFASHREEDCARVGTQTRVLNHRIIES